MIELTRKEYTAERIFINAYKIVSVFSDDNGTWIDTDTGRGFYVNESVEVVISKIEAIFNRGVK